MLIHKNYHHRNILKYYNNYEIDNYIIIETEYLNNYDLKRFVKDFRLNNSHISETLVAYFVIEIVDALLFLNRNEIIHKDIKLQNILLDSDYNIKLCDFSLSKILSKQASAINTKSGTLSYLSIEAFKENYISIKSNNIYKLDVFSLGIMTYILLFDTHPFKYKVRNKINVIYHYYTTILILLCPFFFIFRVA